MTQRAKPTQPSQVYRTQGYILLPLVCDGHALASGLGMNQVGFPFRSTSVVLSAPWRW